MVIQYEAGRVYDRSDIHSAAKASTDRPGNDVAGITVVGDDLCVFWNPYKALYANRWIEEPVEFQYSGEGSKGPMTETGGNRRLLDAEGTGSPVHVFYKVQRNGSHWRHLGEFEVADHMWRTSHGKDGLLREDIRFVLRSLTPSASTAVDAVVEPPKPTPPPPRSEAELWAALQAGGKGGRRQRRTRTQRHRRVSDPLITEYVIARARTFGDACELCGSVAEWSSSAGPGHFQAHHIHPDVDFVDWIAALCGTCHDRMHHSADAKKMAVVLRDTVRSRQLELTRPVVDDPVTQLDLT